MSATALGLDLDADLQIDETDGLGDEDELVSVFTQVMMVQAHRKMKMELQAQDLAILTPLIDARSASLVSRDSLDEMKVVRQERADQVHMQTSQFNRDTKQISLKIMEYEDRVKGLQRQLADIDPDFSNLHDVLEARSRVEARRTRVKELQSRFAAFHGLPPDVDASRNEVRRAMAELESLKSKRDGLFERMGAG